MPRVNSATDKFLREAELSTEEKAEMRDRIGAGIPFGTEDVDGLSIEQVTGLQEALDGKVGTALEITTALQGAEADPTKIGEEFLPESATYTVDQLLSREGETLIDVLKTAHGTGAGLLYFSSVKTTNGSVTVITSTGYAQLIGRDGSLGSPVANDNAITIPAYSRHRAYGIRSCTSLGATSGSITEFNAYDNEITALDISSNSNLLRLVCSTNLLTSLNLAGNPALTLLEMDYNKIETIDLSQNPLIENFICNFNNLKSLDLSANPNLELLWCNDNYLTELNISSNTVLDELDCKKNQISELDVSSNPLLTSLYAIGTRLTLASVNALLSDIDNHGLTDGFLAIEGGTSAAPTNGPPDGIASIASLELKNWTVTTN